MLIWLDAHLSPAIARWMTDTLRVQAVAVRDLGLRDAIDLEIFMAARREAAIVMTKDSDFAYLLDRVLLEAGFHFPADRQAVNQRLRGQVEHGPAPLADRLHGLIRIMTSDPTCQ